MKKEREGATRRDKQGEKAWEGFRKRSKGGPGRWGQFAREGANCPHPPDPCSEKVCKIDSQNRAKTSGKYSRAPGSEVQLRTRQEREKAA